MFSWIFMKIHENLLRGGGTPPSGGSQGSKTPEINEIGVSTVSPLGLGPISIDFRVFNEISLKSRGYPRETWNPSGNSHIKYSGAAEFPGCTWDHPPPTPFPHLWWRLPSKMRKSFIFDGKRHQRWRNPSSLMANAIKDEGNGGGPPFLSNS